MIAFLDQTDVELEKLNSNAVRNYHARNIL